MLKSLFRVSDKGRRNLYLVFFLFGAAVMVLTIYALAEAIEKQDNFRIVRRTISVLIYGIVTVNLFMLFRKASHQLKSGTTSDSTRGQR